MSTGNMLYQSSSNELMLARNYQSQISQKELELKLLNINKRYSSNNSYHNEFQIQSLQSQIRDLKYNRNIHISNAIRYALELVKLEINNSSVLYSTAYFAINSITSYLKIHKISDFVLPIYLKIELLQISISLNYSKLSDATLKTEIQELKNVCNIGWYQTIFLICSWFQPHNTSATIIGENPIHQGLMTLTKLKHSSCDFSVGIMRISVDSHPGISVITTH